MKKGLVIALILILMFLLFSMTASPAAACAKQKKSKDEGDGGTIVKEYGNVELTGGNQSGHFDDIWNLTAGELKITFTYDATGLVDDGFDPETFEGTLATAQFGLRDTTTTDIEPFEKGVWLNTLYDIELDTFDPDKLIDTDWDGIPDTKADNIFDFDDQLMLQRGGPYWDETDYDLPAGQGNPFASSGIWFDRDGVSTEQALWWDFEEGSAYNTDGIYDIELLLIATSKSTGEAYLTINDMKQGFWSGEWSDSEPDMYPAGMSFKGDMENMQIFYGLLGFGAVHTISFNNIKVVQSIEYNLNVEIEVNVIDSVIDYNVIKNIPEDVNIFLDLDVEPKVKRHGDVKVDIDVKIKIKDNVKVNVDLAIEVIVVSADDDVDVDIDVCIKHAGDVRLDGFIDVSDVEDDAEIDIDIDKVKDCSDVYINLVTTARNIGEDAEIEIEVDDIEDCDDVTIDTKVKIDDVGDDAELVIKIDDVEDCNDVAIHTEASLENIGDDAEIEIEIDEVEDCNYVTIDTKVKVDNVDDDAELEVEIDDVEDCDDVNIFVMAILDNIYDDAELEIEAEIEDCKDCNYDINVIPPTTIGDDYDEEINIRIC